MVLHLHKLKTCLLSHLCTPVDNHRMKLQNLSDADAVVGAGGFRRSLTFQLWLKHTDPFIAKTLVGRR